MNPRETARSLAFVPQVHQSVFDFPVQDYLVMGRAPYIDIGSPPSEKDYHVVDQVMERLGVQALAAKSYNELSGGERQQVQIGRALVQEAEIIMLDEPTNHLDFGNQLKILQLLDELRLEGRTVVMTTHMPDHAILLGGRVCIMDSGGKILVGSPDEMITKESMDRLYNSRFSIIYTESLGRKICVYQSLH
jgi:iron complex transport system ATP-binding protein